MSPIACLLLLTALLGRTGPDSEIAARLERSVALAVRQYATGEAVPSQPTDLSAPERLGVKVETVSIPGEPELLAWFAPVERPKATVVVLHGWRSNMAFALGQSAFLLEHGYQLLLVDVRMNRSVGRAEEFAGGLEEDLQDVERAVAHLKARMDVDPQRLAVYGFSYGGLKALLSAARIPELRAVIDDAGPTVYDLAMGPFLEYMPPKTRTDPTWIGRFRKRFDEELTRLLGYGLDRFDLERDVASLKQPLLIIHSADDGFVPIADADRIAAWAPPHRQYLRTEGFGHCLGMKLAPKRYVPRVVGFLDGVFDPRASGRPGRAAPASP